MTRGVQCLLAALLLCSVVTGRTAIADEAEPANDIETKDTPDSGLHWRDDPAVARHPGSYLSGGAGYSQSRAWLAANDEHDDLAFGPLHTYFGSLRVGDAFFEWFAVGFQVLLTNASTDTEQIGAVGLLLDVSFFPWEGLGIRPAVGLGLGFANGTEDWEFGGGGPGCFSLSVLYEIRVTRLFVIAPVVQTAYIMGQEFDGLFLLFGLEFTKWFATATG